jgi:hypothetical protein
VRTVVYHVNADFRPQRVRIAVGAWTFGGRGFNWLVISRKYGSDQTLGWVQRILSTLVLHGEPRMKYATVYSANAEVAFSGDITRVREL